MKLFGHAIAIAFLFIVGVSLVVARARGAGPGAFWRRFFVIAGAAGLVSLGTYIAFPQAFVFFGILHCIALASLLAAPLLPLPGRPRFSPSLVAALAPMLFASPAFDTPWLNWIGLSTFEPLTNDYRPIVPWSAAVFAGVAAAKFWAARGSGVIGGNLEAGPLAWLGEHSLALYLNPPAAALWPFRRARFRRGSAERPEFGRFRRRLRRAMRGERGRKIRLPRGLRLHRGARGERRTADRGESAREAPGRIRERLLGERILSAGATKITRRRR